jgi:ABC-type uncharacterized transport system substrate-binding protein
MRRREFIGVLSGAFVSPLAVSAQQALPVVGFLNPASPDTYSFSVVSFKEGLAKAGFIEGQNLRIEYRWGRGNYALLPVHAADLVAQKVVAIAATGDIASARAAQGATRSIPTVFTIGADPVHHGLVASLGRPGGNITGVNLFSSILSAKRVELLCEIAPKTRRIALLMNPDNLTAPAEQQVAQDAARALGREAFIVNARNPGEINAALAEVLRLGGDAYVTASDPVILDQRGVILAFAQQHSMPGVGFVRQFAVRGALLSYGPSISWMYYQAGLYIGEILKGAKAAELPVMQPTQFETVINLKAAKDLSLDIPPLFLARANEVIE